MNKKQLERIYGSRAEKIRLKNIQEAELYQLTKETTKMSNGKKTIIAPSDKASAGKLFELVKEETRQMALVNANYKTKAKDIRTKYQSVLEAMPAKNREAAREGIEAAIAEELAKLRAETSEARTAKMANITEARKVMNEVLPHLTNPIIQASMYGLDGANIATRSLYTTELANAGPAVVRAAAEQARITGNLHLAAAVLKRSAEFSKEQRPVNSKSYSEMMFGHLTEGVDSYAQGIDIAAETAIAFQKEIDGDAPMSATDKIAFALANPGAGRLMPQDTGDDQPDNSSLAKMVRGLAAADVDEAA